MREFRINIERLYDICDINKDTFFMDIVEPFEDKFGSYDTNNLSVNEFYLFIGWIYKIGTYDGEANRLLAQVEFTLSLVEFVLKD